MKRYLRDWAAITACETKRDQDIDILREQISAIETQAAQDIARYHADQAAAAAVIREQGQSDDEVAELLEISPKQARQLINAARTHPDASPPSAPVPQRTRESATQPANTPPAAANTPERRSAGPGQASNTKRQAAPVEVGALGGERRESADELTAASTPEDDSD
ncbi:hypothetical protein IU450_28625 [Nocardia abscessus]|uniref:hypothetical protein n=1 Tax=Nocardia abscessus TaxID=120957 RepID=UPI001895A3AE|nr:hypothetical protein [Nocardia abscessus]MBF6339826.1 hypothetical protein [Nocardia abscessus]